MKKTDLPELDFNVFQLTRKIATIPYKRINKFAFLLRSY